MVNLGQESPSLTLFIVGVSCLFVFACCKLADTVMLLYREEELEMKSQTQTTLIHDPDGKLSETNLLLHQPRGAVPVVSTFEEFSSDGQLRNRRL